MTIAFISTMAGSSWGGSEELWYQTAIKALEGNHSVVASVYKWEATPDKIQKLQKAGGKIIFRKRISIDGPLKDKVKGKLNELLFGFNDLRKIKKFKPDCIVISQGTVNEIANANCIRFLEKLSIPYFIISQLNTEYNTIPYNELSALRKIFQKAVKNYFVSFRNLDVARRQFCYDFSNASVIHNPVNLDSRQIISWPNYNQVKFAIVARLDSTVKGHAVLFEILNSSVWRIRDWQLNVYGEGKDEKYLKELVSYYKLDERIKFQGHVQSIAQLWSNNHILLLPSTIEGMPLALIEAMVCGRPAVVTDVGGNKELIDEQYTGFIAEAPSVSSFAAAMERMWERRDSLFQMGIESEKQVKRKIDNDSVNTLLGEIISLTNKTI